MSYYMSEIIKLRHKFFEAYNEHEYAQTINLGNEILKLYEENNDLESLEYANDVNNTAIVYSDVLANEKAINLYSKAAEIRKKILGENSAAYTDTISNMAVSLSLEGKHKEALVFHKKALRIRERLLDANSIDLVSSYFNLASSYDDLGKLDEALENFEKSLKKADKQKDLSKKDYADILIGFSRVLAKKGIYKKAVPNYCKVVEIIKTEEGEKNFYYISVLLEVAGICEKAKFYEQAIVYYKRAIENRKLILEKTHLDYVANMNSLAQAFVKKGDYNRAIEAHKEILELLKDLVGVNHQFYAECINNLGIDYLKKKRFIEAKAYFEEALKIKEDIFGINSIPYTNTQEWIGHLYKEEKGYDMAIEIYNEVLIERKQSLGGNDNLYGETLLNLGIVYLEKKDFVQAINYLEEALFIKQKNDIKRDMSLIYNLQYLAEAYSLAGNKNKAIILMDDAANERKKIYGETHPKFARGLFNMAKIEMRCGRYEHAVKNLNYAINIQRATIGEANPDFKESMNFFRKSLVFLTNYYFELNEFEKSSIKFFKGLDTFIEKEVREKTEYIIDCFDIYAKNTDSSTILEFIEKNKKDAAKKYGEISVEYALVYKLIGRYSLINNDLKSAEENFAKAIEIEHEFDSSNPKSLGEISYLLGVYAYKNKEYGKALEYYNKINEKNGKAYYYKSLYKIGEYNFQLKKYDKCIDYVKDAVKALEKNYSEHLLENSIMCKKLSMCYEKLKDMPLAEEWLITSLELRRDISLWEKEDYIADLVKLSEIARKNGDKTYCYDLLNEASSILNQKVGDTEEFAEMIFKTAKVAIELKKYDIAEMLLAKCVEIKIEYHHKYGDEVALALYEMLKLYKKMKYTEKISECLASLNSIYDGNEQSILRTDKYSKLFT